MLSASADGPIAIHWYIGPSSDAFRPLKSSHTLASNISNLSEPPTMTSRSSDTTQNDQFKVSSLFNVERWVAVVIGNQSATEADGFREEKQIPAGRPGRDRDMAQAVLHFAVNQYVNGQTIAVDGGFLLGNP
ncbi:hypothetical protein OF83DRAFT_1172010 [Amylostereum chailletii]|nr:hypothetical protein OF83DRAFT_1172010 [Amylostereum chailletii]